MKLKVVKLFNYAPAFDMYVVDFIREAGKTMAITISEDNKIEKFKYIKMGIRDYKNNIFGKFEK